MYTAISLLKNAIYICTHTGKILDYTRTLDFAHWNYKYVYAYSMFMSFKDVTLIVDTMFLYVEKEYKKKITNLYEI
jgi:hypothetical protein